MNYYDRKGRRVSEEEGRRLFGDANNNGRKVALTRMRVQDGTVLLVSTVHLVLDHGFGVGTPLIFESMVFGPDGREFGDWTTRYAKESDALSGHADIVQGLWLQHDGQEILQDEVCPSPLDDLIIEEF